MPLLVVGLEEKASFCFFVAALAVFCILNSSPFDEAGLLPEAVLKASVGSFLEAGLLLELKRTPSPSTSTDCCFEECLKASFFVVFFLGGLFSTVNSEELEQPITTRHKTNPQIFQFSLTVIVG
jgi:hypothetical protein